MKEEVFDSVYQEEIYSLRKKPLIVLQESWESLSIPERELLIKIIGALKLSISEIQITSSPILDIQTYINRAEKLIWFGSKQNQYNNYNTYQQTGLSFICSDSLKVLLENDSLKKQLWITIKQLFLGQ